MKNKIHLFNQVYKPFFLLLFLLLLLLLLFGPRNPQACIYILNIHINNFNFEIAWDRFSTIRHSVINERVEEDKGNNKQYI